MPKTEDLLQGMAQCLIGCEVASDVDKIDIVYGIVTTFSCQKIIPSDFLKIKSLTVSRIASCVFYKACD